MSHVGLTVPTTLSAATESTRRTLRGILQNVGAAIALALLVATPPVADAVNAVLALVGVDAQISSALLLAIATLLTAAGAIVTKLQNLLEGRDQVPTPAAWAAQVITLTDQITTLRAALAAAVAAAQHSSTSSDLTDPTTLPVGLDGLTDLERAADAEAAALDPTPGRVDLP